MRDALQRPDAAHDLGQIDAIPDFDDKAHQGMAVIALLELNVFDIGMDVAMAAATILPPSSFQRKLESRRVMPGWSMNSGARLPASGRNVSQNYRIPRLLIPDAALPPASPRARAGKV